MACDISDAGTVESALEQIQGNGRPSLDSVIHAAGVFLDAMLERQSAESFASCSRLEG